MSFIWYSNDGSPKLGNKSRVSMEEVRSVKIYEQKQSSGGWLVSKKGDQVTYFEGDPWQSRVAMRLP